MRENHYSLKLPILVIVSILIFMVSLDGFSQSRMPKESYNYIAITGTTGSGSRDKVNLAFFEVPDTITSTLYFSIYDPGCNDVLPDRGALGNTTFYLMGGTGTLSDNRSRQWEYTDAEITSNDHLVGTILDTRIHGNDAVGWVYFQGVSPFQGEHIGNKYYFKVVAEADVNIDKNAYQLWISYSNSGTPTGVSGVKSFAYSWCIALMDLSNNFEIYPFVPEGETGYIVYSNWDFDEGDSGVIITTGTGYNKSNAQTETSALAPTVSVSLNDVVANTSYQITVGEDNGTWKAKYNEGPALPAGYNSNPADVWFWNSAAAVNDTVSFPPSDSVVYRAYSTYFTNPSADHITLSFDDGTAEADGVDLETIVLHVVDSSGTPIPYSKKIWVELSGSGKIKYINDVDQGATPPSSAYVITDGTGIATIKIIDSSQETVTVTATTNGNTVPGTAADEANLPGVNDSANVDFLTNPDPTISSASNRTFIVGDPSTAIPQITIKNSPNITNITAANDIRVRIPAGMDCEFNTAILDLTGNLTVTGSGVVSNTVIYPTSKILFLDVTTGFAAGDTLDISGLEMNNFNIESSGSLEFSFDGGANYTSIDDKLYSIADNNAPSILSRETADLDDDGYIDAILITFSKSIDDSPVAVGDFAIPAVTGKAFSSTTNGDSANDSDIYITFNDGALDTAQTPTIQYTQGTLADLSTNLLPSDGAPVATTDRAPPAAMSVTADDPDDGDAVYSNGDTITFVFSENTNQPSVNNKTELDALFAFSPTLGTAYSGSWSDAKTLVITITDISGGTEPVLNTKTFTLQASGNLKDAAGTSPASIDTSPAISGDWGQLAGPTVSSVTADDTDDGDTVYSNGDTITVVFSEATNQVAAGTKAEIDAIFSFNEVLGSDYTGLWSAADTLMITVVDSTGATPPTIGGLQLTFQAGNGVKNAAGTSLESSGTSAAIVGDWGQLAGPTITGGILTADNSYVDITFNVGVYNTNGGAGALETTDFNLNFQQNGGDATGATIASVTKNDNNPLIGGETIVRVHLSITGIPNGVETVEITPIDNASIYNFAGVAAAVTETTGGLTLNAGATTLASGTVIIRNNIINPNKGEITTINFRLTESTKVNVTIYDLAGNPVKVLYNRTGNPGLNETLWDGNNKKGKTVIQGVYFVVVKIGKKRYMNKVLVVK